jgi:hypothetical protein
MRCNRADSLTRQRFMQEALTCRCARDLQILATSLLAAAPAEHVRPVAWNTRSRISFAMDRGVTGGVLLLVMLLLKNEVTSKYASSSDMASKCGSYVLRTCHASHVLRNNRRHRTTIGR